MLKKYRNSIVAKTTAIHLLIIMAVGTIVLVSLLQSIHVRGRVENTVAEDVSAMLFSAQTGRTLNSTFADASVLLATFPEKKEYLNARRVHLLQTIQAHREKLRKEAAKPRFIKALEQFTAALRPVLDQCGRINDVFNKIRHSENALQQELASVETVLVKRMLRKKIVEADTLRQLGTMISVYRETLYRGAIRLEAVKEAFLSGQGDKNAAQREVNEFAEGFHADLMLLNTSGNEFVQHGRRIFGLLDEYRNNMLTLVEALDLFQNRMKHFRAVQKKLNREMENFDAGIADTAARMEIGVKEAVRSSLLYITLLSACIMAGLIFLTVLIRKTIAPIGPLAARAREIAQGRYAMDEDVRAVQAPVAEKNDEIAELARDFEKMRVELLDREKALRESRAILTATLESTRDGVLVVKEGGEVSLHNTRFAEIWSIPEELLKMGRDEELIAHVFSLLVDPEQFMSGVNELYQSSKISEDFLYLKDGRVLERITYPLMQGAHKSGRAWFFRDITGRKQMELALRESEERLDLALSGANEGIWDWRIDKNAVYFDSRYYTMAGYRPDEFPCAFEEWEKRVHPDDLEAAKAPMNQCLAGKLDAYEAEFRFQRKDGCYMWIRSKGKIVKLDDRGNPTRFVGTHADITELKRTQLELERFRFTIEQAPDAVFWMDRQAQFIYVNKQACRSLGYAQKELEGHYLWNIDPFYPKEKYFERWKNFEKDAANDVLQVETTHKRKDGSFFPVEILSKHIEADGTGLNVVFARDITDRKQAEEALNEERNRIANILEATNAGTCEWNYQTGEVHLNPRWAGIMGKTLDELDPIGAQTLSDCSHPDDLPEILRILDRLISREVDYFDFDFRQPHKNGGWVWVNTRGKVVEWTKDGKPLRISGTNLDITEKKQAEEALKQNYIQLKAIYNTLPVIIWASDANGVFTMSEGKELEKLGLRPGQVAGQSIFDLYSGNPVIIEKTKRALKGEKCEYITEVAGHFYHNFNTPFFDENNEVRGVNGLAINVTENRKTEEEVRRLRNYLSNIINSMPSVLVGVDAEGRVTQWNRWAEQATGLLSEKVIARPLDTVLTQMTDQMNNIKTAIQERRVINSSKVTRKDDHETRFEDITIFPLIANGVEGAVIRVDDVTEQVHLEEMMIQGEKMLSVGGLAAGMAHEINNPLAGMLQTANVMANRLGAGIDIPANRRAAEAAGTTMEVIEKFMTARGIPRMLSTITESGRRVTEIVNNMLSFARKSEAVVFSQDLGNLLDTTLELAKTDYDLKKQYDFKQISIEKKYAEPPVSAPCEAAKIQQVLLNILRNGAQAMQEAETEAPRFIFRTRLENNPKMAVIEIEDNGPGMDKVTRKRIFEPFFTTKPEGAGTGLGLSVSYFIITENHQGEMAVESEPGGGAKFIIRLPVEG